MVLGRRDQNGRNEVPEVVIQRLPVYIRVLEGLLKEGVEVASSQQVGERLQITPAQVRKDLSYLGRFGKQGRGYHVRNLIDQLKRIIGLDREWKVAVVGVGRLGRAILSYPGFRPQGFLICAAFDVDPAVVGTKVGDLTVLHVREMPRVITEHRVKMAIVAVPADHAQEVIDQLVECGVRAILNYAPISPYVPRGVKVRNIDPVLALQTMTYYLLGEPATEEAVVDGPASSASGPPSA